jgi:hypothetical protein
VVFTLFGQLGSMCCFAACIYANKEQQALTSTSSGPPRDSDLASTRMAEANASLLQDRSFTMTAMDPQRSEATYPRK